MACTLLLNVPVVLHCFREWCVVSAHGRARQRHHPAVETCVPDQQGNAAPSPESFCDCTVLFGGLPSGSTCALQVGCGFPHWEHLHLWSAKKIITLAMTFAVFWPLATHRTKPFNVMWHPTPFPLLSLQKPMPATCQSRAGDASVLLPACSIHSVVACLCHAAPSSFANQLLLLHAKVYHTVHIEPLYTGFWTSITEYQYCWYCCRVVLIPASVQGIVYGWVQDWWADWSSDAAQSSQLATLCSTASKLLLQAGLAKCECCLLRCGFWEHPLRD